MALQESIYPDTTLSDFTSVLLRENNKNQNKQFIGDRSVNTSPNYDNSPANRNLSSVLSQIQDDGPAYGDLRQRSNSGNCITEENEKSGVASGEPQAGGSYDDVLSVSSSGLQKEQDRATNSDSSKKKTSPGILLQLLLLIVTALLAMTIFRFDVRTDNLEKMLNIFDEKIQGSMVFQSEYVSTDITETNEALRSLQDELQLIKNDYSALDKKYVTMTDESKPETKGVASIQDNVSVMKYEILSLKSELQAVKNKLKMSKKDKRSTAAVISGSGLTVSLASLTNKDKVEKIAEQLNADGWLPSIKQAVVKGERVYRLSVSGFSDRKEAELFIVKAGKKYGMKDGLIRKTQDLLM